MIYIYICTAHINLFCSLPAPKAKHPMHCVQYLHGLEKRQAIVKRGINRADVKHICVAAMA